MGREFGMRTILPLTGATGAGDLAQSVIKPDLVVDSVAALANEHWSIIESWLS
jgi:ribonucleotide monophosphatase NagD (HAD superfamily)